MQGYKRPLMLEDIFDLAPEDQVQVVSRDFERHWKAQLAKKGTGGEPSLVRMLQSHCTSLRFAEASADFCQISCRGSGHVAAMRPFYSGNMWQ